MRSAGRALRGLGAVAALVGLLIGVPVFLAAAVGWPLPRAVPAWADITATFQGELPLDADTVWKVLACVVWVAWAQIVVATLVEAAALARGGVAAPIRGLAHMQGLTGPLLGAAVLLLPGSFAPPPARPGPSLVSARALVAHTDLPAAAAEQPDSDAVPSPSEPETIEHTVVRHDTLWDLAERYLAPGGDVGEVSAAVRTLFELNQGRPQPDGSALTDASLLRPGWVLRIPVPAAPSGGELDVTVAPGDSLWAIAEEHLGDGHRYREVFDRNVGRPQPDGDTLTDPSLIKPGWTFELPATATPADPPAPAPAPPAPPPPIEPAAPTTVGSPAPPPTRPAEPRSDGPAQPQPPPTDGQGDTPGRSHHVDDDQRAPIGVFGVAGGFLAAGLAAAVSVRRRRQRMRRTPGTELPSLPADAAPVLDALADEDLDVTLGVDHALRRLGRVLADREQVPVPVIATVNANKLDLLLDRDCPTAPEGWEAVAAGRIWQTTLDASFDDPSAGPAWLPTLVSLGALDGDGLLLNLEAVGAVGLVGDPAAVSALARSITLELALTPLADVPTVHGAADAVGDLESVPNVSVHPDFAAAFAAAVECAAGISGALAGADFETATELRCRAPEEAWPPAVLIVPAAADDDRRRLVVERCQERAGVVAVFVGGCPPGVLEITVTPETVSIPALDLHCTVQQLPEAATAAITELLDAADETAVEPSGQEPLTLFPADECRPSDTGNAGTVYLHLLGPVTVEGADLQPQQVAIVAYMALHGEVTADALRDAIWGGRPPTRERFLNTIHELRRTLGPDVLPASTDGRYRLHNVWCDAAEADRLVARSAAEPDEAPAHLRAALELVTGPPISYDSRHRRHFRWVDLGNHTSRWERVVGDAAHQLSSLALAAGDIDLARWAAERGLLACPGSETLTGDLVRAYIAAGDLKTAERVIDEFARALEDAGDSNPPDALYELLEPRRAS